MSKEIYHRFKRNAAMILGSHFIFGLLNVATSITMVRLFGLGDLGVVILLQSYTRIFNVFIKFNSWQAVVTYGAVLQEKKDQTGLKRLLGLLLSVDLVGITIGVVAAITFSPFAARIFEWPDQVTTFAPIYVLSIVFATNSTPSGILRLFDMVNVLAAKYALKSVVRFVGVILVFLLDGNVFHLVLVWFIASVVSGLLPIVFCALVLFKRNLIPVFRINWFTANKEFKGIWRFLGFANISNAIGFVHRTGTTLFLGFLLGAAPAAIFEIAYQFTGALSRPIRLLGPIISPEFAKLVAKGDWITFRKILTKQLKITGSILLVVSVVSFSVLNFAVETIYGTDVLENIWLFRFLLLFVLLKILTFTFEPAILSANKPGFLFIVRCVVALCYSLVGLSLINQFGLAAVGFAALTGQILYMFIFGFQGRKLLRKRTKKQSN